MPPSQTTLSHTQHGHDATPPMIHVGNATPPRVPLVGLSASAIVGRTAWSGIGNGSITIRVIYTS